MNGYFDGWYYYQQLPYKYPIIELMPPVRIPIAGPDPFNTLVVVQSQVPVTDLRVSDGDLHRFRFVCGNAFRLIGHDPRVPPPFEHSTTASLHITQESDDSTFVVAIDAVDGYFDSSGNWVVVADVASQWDQVLATGICFACSWVLCWEPPSPDRPRAKSDIPLQFPSHPPRPWPIQTLVKGDRQSQDLERLVRLSRRRRERRHQSTARCLESQKQKDTKPLPPKFAIGPMTDHDLLAVPPEDVDPNE